MKKIIVKENEEFRIKLITDFSKNEFFYDAFVQAKLETEFIVKDTVTYHSTQNDTMFDFSNNIIAFSGDRGQGKSSAMLSFSNALKNSKTQQFSDFLGNVISERSFVVLDRIDPTKLEENDNILLIIIGKIFHEFCKLWNNSNKQNVSLYNNLLEQFQLCYEEIITIKNNNAAEQNFGGALDYLSRLGDSNNLKKDLWDLLQMFFEFESKCENKSNEKDKNFLVIQLDDTDLNTQNAYRIVEEIRKYFMIPNVIVLMAIDIKQLTNVVEQYFIGNYKVFQAYYLQERLIDHRKIAVKYIDKLIPGNRKIFLPKLTLLTGENVERVSIEYLDGEKNNILYFKDSKEQKISDIQELIIRLIYEKTGIVFIKPRTYVHDIIPNSMRELVNFLSVLNKMPSIKNDFSDLTDINLRIENLKRFETYFVEVWIPNNVRFEYIQIVNNFIVASMATKNKQLIKDIKSKVTPIISISSEKYSATYLTTRLFSKIEARGVYSLADIRTLLNSFENEFPQEDTYKFVFAIRTLYSIYLGKIICSQLINEKNGEPVDMDLLLDFLGGEIFSDSELNGFMRQGIGKIDRGSFEINTVYSENEHKELKELIFGNSYFLSFFFNFKYKSFQSNLPKYKRPYKLNNGVESRYIKYNAFSPIIKHLDPVSCVKRLGVNNYEMNDELYDIRNQCMKLVSNVHLINYIGKKLQDYSSMRSVNNFYTEHLINLYVRLDSCFKDLRYLKLNISFEKIISQITVNTKEINRIFEIYTALDAEFDVRIILSREGLSDYLIKLNALRRTKTFDILRTKTQELLKSLLSYNKVLRDEELSQYINRLQAFEQKMVGYSGILDGNNRNEYQGEYNRILKELKKEFVDSTEDEI